YPVRFTSETSASGIYRKDGFFVLTECVAQTSLTAVDAASHSIPTEFRLLQNYPNPFNPETTIEFHLPQPAEVNLTIFDLHGKIVRQLGRASLPAGIQTIRWDGKNEFDRLVASGIYVCRIEARSAAGEHSFTDAKKMILMK
ncbi:T9SS type A sorting domain-containing protein, partial [candidate division KSB1 bacterium]|nr:T9SS type A sorting domain-containing protein [candidate division KSB1 bacterium]